MTKEQLAQIIATTAVGQAYEKTTHILTTPAGSIKITMSRVGMRTETYSVSSNINRDDMEPLFSRLHWNRARLALRKYLCAVKV